MMSLPPIRASTNSIKARIVLLAVLTCLLLAASAVTLIYLLQNTESSLVNGAESHLTTLAQTLAQDCVTHIEYQSPSNHPIALDTPQDPGSDQVLSLMTSVVLRHEIGIEGGFYSTTSDDLLGYAFPTHPGPGIKRDIPPAERPEITRLARKAASSGQVQSLRFSGARDAIVFVAAPIKVNGKVLGSTWMMQRMPGVNSGRNLQLLFGSSGFALAAFACALIAFLITTQVQSGVNAVLTHLGSLEQDLSGPRTSKPQLAEFERVLTGVDRLSLALKQKIERERNLENQLRHQERLSALGQFAAGIAHELRSPLATIRLRTQMSESATGSEAIHKNCNVVLNEINRLDGMIERLLYFSRPIHLALQPLDLAELCEQTLKAWEGRLQTANIQSRFDGNGPVIVVADGDKLRQVLDNLMANAMEAIAENGTDGGRIVIATKTENGYAEIEVMDNGAGLPADVRSKALDPFFTTKDRGTGLGLSIAYEIVKAHDGELNLDNNPAGGARVLVRLPLRTGQEQDVIEQRPTKGVVAE